MQKRILVKLVERMKQGDESAFLEIYEEFYHPLFYIALELTHNHADAEDIVQNTFIQIHKSVHALKEPSVFVLWMKRILLNKSRNLFRDRKNVIYADDVVVAGMDEKAKDCKLADQETHKLTSRQIIHHMVKQLTYLQQEVIVLHYFDQLKIKEIAKILEVSEGTIKSRMNAAKVNLRKVCDVYEEENNERISMHAWNMSLVLTSMYGSLYLPSPWKKCKFQAQSIVVGAGPVTVAATASIVISAGAIAIPYVAQQLQSEHESILPKEVIKADQGDEDVYFNLRSWAHCIDEMEVKESSSYEAMYPLYIQLRDHAGPYWDALVKDYWAQDFLKIYNEKAL